MQHDTAWIAEPRADGKWQVRCGLNRCINSPDLAIFDSWDELRAAAVKYAPKVLVCGFEIELDLPPRGVAINAQIFLGEVGEGGRK